MPKDLLPTVFAKTEDAKTWKEQMEEYADVVTPWYKRDLEDDSNGKERGGRKVLPRHRHVGIMAITKNWSPRCRIRRAGSVETKSWASKGTMVGKLAKASFSGMSQAAPLKE